MKAIFRFGENVDGYNIPVLNEREIRAAAGLWFLMLFTSVMFVSFKENFILFKFSIIAFLLDFIIRVLINPRYSPSLILGRLIVFGYLTFMALMVSAFHANFRTAPYDLFGIEQYFQTK